ncbi:MAG: M28 family peptidase [Pseudomonadota bacterium]
MTTLASNLDASASAHSAPAQAATGGAANTLSLHYIIGALLALLLMIMLGLQNSAPPASVSATAPADVFSAGRAMDKLRHIASKPHPVGTAANGEVRDYLVAELKALGLAPELQSELGASALMSAVGNVHNIVARVPGRVPGKAVMLAAHYDSVPSGFGAADDGASVAAILETVHALNTGGRLKNDLIILLTDGEEAGLLGSEAFVSKHRWAKDVGVALNFEYRGNSGRMLMFETSPGNGKLVEALGRLKDAAGNSLLYEVYRMLPNDTDMSAFKRAGMTGMNFAAMERPTSYHTDLDRPEMLNLGTMQQQGDIMLALARHFGEADLADLKSGDRIYFELPVIGMVSYSGALAMPLGLVCALLLGATLVLGVRSGELRLVRTVVASVVLPFIAIIIAVACTLLWGGIKGIHPQYKSLFDVYNSHWYWMAFVALAIGLFMLAHAVVRRWLRAYECAVGAALLWVVLLFVCVKTAPGATFILTWPLIPALAALAYLFTKSGQGLTQQARLLLLVGTAAPGVIMFAPLVRTLYVAMTTAAGGIALFVMVLLLGLFVPLLSLLKRRFVFPAVPMAAALMLLIVGSLTAGVSATQPATNNLVYMRDGASGNAMWLSTDAALDSWNRPVFGDKAVMRQVPEVFGAKARPYWTAPADALPVPPAAPTVEILHDEVVGEVRTIGIRLKSMRAADELKMYAEDAEVLSASVRGRPVLSEPKEDWLFAAYNMGAEAADIEMTVKPGKPFLVRVIDTSYGLPASGPAHRKPDMIMRPFGVSDAVRAVTSVGFN